MARTRTKPPWEQPTKPSPRATKASAARTRRARRRYPNLVDAMPAAAESHGDRRLAVTRTPARREDARSTPRVKTRASERRRRSR